MPRLTRKRKIHKGGAADELIGVLISQNSLTHENPGYNGAPYVVIIPEKFNGGTKGYAYGVSAVDAVKAAQNKRFRPRGFEATDKYSGVGLSAARIMSANAKEKVAPYVIDLGEKGLRYGSSPAQITGTRRILDRFKKSFQHRANQVELSLRRKSAPAAAVGAAVGAAATAADPLPSAYSKSVLRGNSFRTAAAPPAEASAPADAARADAAPADAAPADADAAAPAGAALPNAYSKAVLPRNSDAPAEPNPYDKIKRNANSVNRPGTYGTPEQQAEAIHGIEAGIVT